jgi:hypothetical protein
LFSLAHDLNATRVELYSFFLGSIYKEMGRASSARGFLENIRPPKKPKICQDVPLHQVLRHIYEALNIDENKN